MSRQVGSRVLSLLFSIILSFVFVFAAPNAVSADRATIKTVSTPRYILHVGSSSASNLKSSPVVENVTEQTLSILDEVYDELSRIFHVQPRHRLIVRFLDPEEFRRQTGAPAWTSAMFFHGEVTIPVSPDQPIDLAELTRTLRHEYTHAVIAELTNYRCPAWLDEGVAQIIEGEPNPLLGPALRKWVRAEDAMPFSWLVNGFTTLDRSMVPAAYAQSLFATRTLVNSHGMNSVLTYLEELRNGESQERAFSIVYGKSLKQFETELTGQMRRWAKSKKRHP